MQLENKKAKELEYKLSKLGSLAADAFDEVNALHDAMRLIEGKLCSIQKQIEQIYLTLEEPLILGINHKTPEKGVQMGGKAASPSDA